MKVHRRVRMPSPRLSSFTSLITRNKRKKLILIIREPLCNIERKKKNSAFLVTCGTSQIHKENIPYHLWNGPCQAIRNLRTCAKCTNSNSSCACLKYHHDICSPLIHSIVSNDSVSRQQRTWSDCTSAQSAYARRRFHMARPKYAFT